MSKLGSKFPSMKSLLTKTGRSPLSSTDTSSPGRGGRTGATNGTTLPEQSGQTSGQTKSETDA